MKRAKKKPGSILGINEGVDKKGCSGKGCKKSCCSGLLYGQSSANRTIIVKGGGGGSTIWGSIQGDISNQEDLIQYIEQQISEIPLQDLQSVLEQGSTANVPDSTIQIISNNFNINNESGVLSIYAQDVYGDEFNKIELTKGISLISDSQDEGINQVGIHLESGLKSRIPGFHIAFRGTFREEFYNKAYVLPLVHNENPNQILVFDEDGIGEFQSMQSYTEDSRTTPPTTSYMTATYPNAIAGDRVYFTVLRQEFTKMEDGDWYIKSVNTLSEIE